MNTRGVATRNHKANKATKVPNGIAAELELAHRTKFNTKNKPNTKLKDSKNH